MSVGTMIGIIVKAIALRDERTIWSRKSSGLNILTYPTTALAPMYSLGLYVTFFSTFISFLVWIGIYIWRSPESEDWLGRVEMTYTEYSRMKVAELEERLITCYEEA